MKIHPTSPAGDNDLARFEITTAPLFVNYHNGMSQLADKHKRLQRLAARARHERRWKKEEERRA